MCYFQIFVCKQNVINLVNNCFDDSTHESSLVLFDSVLTVCECVCVRARGNSFSRKIQVRCITKTWTIVGTCFVFFVFYLKQNIAPALNILWLFGFSQTSSVPCCIYIMNSLSCIYHFKPHPPLITKTLHHLKIIGFNNHSRLCGSEQAGGGKDWVRMPICLNIMHAVYR